MKVLVAVMLGSLIPGIAPALAALAKIISIKGTITRLGPCGFPDKNLAVGHPLNNGCQLTATDPNATIQIECTNGATLQPLTGGFVVAINGTGVPSCALKLKLGSAMATSSGTENEEGSASIETGALGAVVKHTSVVVTVPASGAVNAEACVIDGEALVTRGGTTISLVAGKMAYANSTAVKDIPDSRLRWVADNLAVATTTGAGVQVSPAAQTQLSDRYLAVYRNSKDSAARSALAQNLQAVSAPNNSFTRYQQAQDFKLHSMGQTQVVVPAPPPAPPLAHQVVVPGPAVYVTPGKFSNPTLQGRRVDICFHWGVECGKPAADAFCRAKSFASAAEFTVAENIGAHSPTLVIGDNKVCANPSCDGFAVIRCQ